MLCRICMLVCIYVCICVYMHMSIYVCVLKVGIRLVSREVFQKHVQEVSYEFVNIFYIKILSEISITILVKCLSIYR